MDRTLSGRATPRSYLPISVALLSVIAVADTFGGAVQNVFPATLLLRSGMGLFLTAYVLMSSKIRQDIRILCIALTSYLVARASIDYFFVSNTQVLSMELSSSFRMMYFPFLFIYLHSQIEQGKMVRSDLSRILLLYGWLVLASLALGEFTGLGGKIGGRGLEVEGGKGFMIGANEVGLMLILTSPFIGADIMRRIKSVWFGGLAQLIIYVWAGSYVFTKSGLMSALTSAFSVYRSLTARSVETKWMARLFLGASSVFIARLFFLQMDRLEVYSRDNFFSSIFSDGFLIFLLRGRQDYIDAIYPQLAQHAYNWFFLLFGAGEFFMRELSTGPLMLEEGKGTTFEMDAFDLISGYGLVGSALFIALIRQMVLAAKPYRFPADVKFIFFCVLTHACLAGHVLFSPQVTTLLALVLLYFRVDGGRLKNTSTSTQQKF